MQRRKGPAAWVLLEDLQEPHLAPGSAADPLRHPGHFASILWGPVSPFTFCLFGALQHRNTHICVFGQSSAMRRATFVLKSDKAIKNSISFDQPEKRHASPPPPQDAPP